MTESIYQKFNRESFTPARRQAIIDELEGKYGPIGFRPVETPVFITPDFRDQMLEAIQVYGRQLLTPEYLAEAEKIVPPQFKGGQPGHPAFWSIDFAITRDADGRERPELVELQGASSMYAFVAELADAYQRQYGLGPEFQYLLADKSREEFLERLKREIVGDHDPKNVVLMDDKPKDQKFYMDHVAFEKRLGIKVLDAADAIKRGNKLYYKDNGAEIEIKRIYNRSMPEEAAHALQTAQFSYSDPTLEVEWKGHPAWHHRISKFSLPYLHHPTVPETHFLRDVKGTPKNLEDLVMKPLLSFSGSGVVIDLTKAHLDAVRRQGQEDNTILMRKIKYADVVPGPDGKFSQAEVRVMCFSTPENGITPVIMWARVKRHALASVAHNKVPGTGAGPVFVTP